MKILLTVLLIGYLVALAMWLTGHLSYREAGAAFGGTSFAMTIGTFILNKMNAKVADRAKSDALKKRDGA